MWTVKSKNSWGKSSLVIKTGWKIKETSQYRHILLPSNRGVMYACSVKENQSLYTDWIQNLFHARFIFTVLSFAYVFLHKSPCIYLSPSNPKSTSIIFFLKDAFFFLLTARYINIIYFLWLRVICYIVKCLQMWYTVHMYLLHINHIWSWIYEKYGFCENKASLYNSWYCNWNSAI